jgi:hypothetical protein
MISRQIDKISERFIKLVVNKDEILQEISLTSKAIA